MNYSCPNCGGTAMFDPESGKMKCTQCGSLVTSAFSIKMDEIMDETIKPEEEQKKQPSAISGEERARRYKEKIEKGSGDIGIGYYYDEDIETGDQRENASEEEDLPEEAYMEINVYRCTSCGAELMINDKEASTFCAFCGQPTIVFDRVSRELQPNYIIPFEISEEEAVEKIRDKFVKGTFVPNRVKNPDVDKVRGIYIPFWLFTSHIRMQANIVGEIRRESHSSKNSAYKSNEYVEAVSYYRDAECTFERVTVDASRKLNDQMSQRLEPYNLKALRPFDSQYLSGFYADKYDVDVQDVGVIAHNRAKELMEEGLKDSCRGTSMEVIQSKDTYEVESIEYALLPAWFMTFRYDDELYTVLVNGQTGKVIGNVPIDKKIATGWFIGAVVFSCLIISPLVAFLTIGAFTARRAGNIIALLIGIVSACVGTFVKGIVRWRHYKRDHARFKSQMTLQYVKKRQDKTWIR